MSALLKWVNDPTDAEPEGWYRNPRSGRRRPGGFPEQEYIEW